ncbi:hypothetical protein CPLU01_11781 [Colletotrichum plurivorum]|uniref:Uncharacterized protein n=1 Tax=Colletotrichum plurivorum TaxID=2175906 RepID=A0A8H6N787_9PEZI|nr:hypothetical protein CPLU01_11781 [Colletotrichum plurivorum]
MAPSTDDLLRELLRCKTLAEAERLALSSPALNQVFKDNKLRIVKKHIAPMAWPDAVACVDRRLNGSKTARKEFDKAYADKTHDDIPKNEEFWGLTDLCDLVKIIDDLLDRIAEAGDDSKVIVPASDPFAHLHPGPPEPTKRPPGNFNNLTDWEADWRSDKIWVTAADPHPMGDRGPELDKDQGTESAGNFHHAFARRAKFDPKEARPGYEGCAVDYYTRPRLQRAFFRLEFLRRAHYQRPLFPRGAKWQCRTATLDGGEPACAPGETTETRLARAEQVFAGWDRDDFVEIVCAFRATLNYYAVPLADMLDDFVRDLRGAVVSDEVNRIGPQLDRAARELAQDAKCIGLQWEHNPLFFGAPPMPDIPLWDVPPDNDFLEMRAQLQDRESDLRSWQERRFKFLARAGFHEVGCSVFRPSDVYAKRQRSTYPMMSLDEAHPEALMHKFLHVLVSLPLRFLTKFLRMSRSRQRRFLKGSFEAVHRVKMSRAPAFLSGEVRAWSSQPAVGDRRKNWDCGSCDRIFPELAVRSVSLSILNRLYEVKFHPYYGHYVRMSEDLNRAVWRWDEYVITPLSWADLRAKIAYKPYPVDRVLRMSPESWRAVWWSDRQVLRQFWTGPGMDRKRGEGFGQAAAGRSDPDECYCSFGQGCALCIPLPHVDVPEWELFTPEEIRGELAMDEYLRNFEMELEPLAWVPPPRTTIPVDEAAVSLLQSLDHEFKWSPHNRHHRKGNRHLGSAWFLGE